MCQLNRKLFYNYSRLKPSADVLSNLHSFLALYNANPKNLANRKDMRWIAHNTSIIHYCGINKPWKKSYRGVLGIFYYYFENLAKKQAHYRSNSVSPSP